MISTLRGIAHISPDQKSVVMQTSGGVGYLVFITPQCASFLQEGKEATLFTFLRVAEGVLDLYGFESLVAKGLFERLISVSGIGPKTALCILATGPASTLEDAISRGDVAYLTAVQGIGKKTAERLVVELKGKVSLQQSYESSSIQEVSEALLSMGYSGEDVRSALHSLDSDGKTTEQILKEVLKKMK